MAQDLQEAIVAVDRLVRQTQGLEALRPYLVSLNQLDDSINEKNKIVESLKEEIAVALLNLNKTKEAQKSLQKAQETVLEQAKYDAQEIKDRAVEASQKLLEASQAKAEELTANALATLDTLTLKIEKSSKELANIKAQTEEQNDLYSKVKSQLDTIKQNL